MAVTAANIEFQSYKFSTTISSGTWKWTTRVNVSASAPVYEVVDIVTPFGILRDTIPLPGEVVQCMSESIDQLQANFPPTILLGPPPDLTFDVDEGFGFSDPQSVTITNDGVYGSLLDATLSSSAAYVTTSPANVGNLASNEAGAFQVAVDSSSLLAANTPYAETITAQDSSASNSPQVYNVTINVRPKATIALSAIQLNFVVTKPLTGPFPAIPSQMFIVENTGPATSLLDFQIARLTALSNDWLSSFAPITGQLASAVTEDITVTVAPITTLGLGVYTEQLRVSGFSTNQFVDITIQLTIT